MVEFKLFVYVRMTVTALVTDCIVRRLCISLSLGLPLFALEHQFCKVGHRVASSVRLPLLPPPLTQT